MGALHHPRRQRGVPTGVCERGLREPGLKTRHQLHRQRGVDQLVTSLLGEMRGQRVGRGTRCWGLDMRGDMCCALLGLGGGWCDGVVARPWAHDGQRDAHCVCTNLHRVLMNAKFPEKTQTCSACMASFSCGMVNAGVPGLNIPAFSVAISCTRYIIVCTCASRILCEHPPAACCQAVPCGQTQVA